MSEIHLFPHFCDGVGIEPLIRSRAADIVEVIINSCAAAAFSFFCCRQPPDIAPVIVAPEQRHIVRHAHAFVVVTLHFLVEGPNLRIGGDVGVLFRAMIFR